MKKWLLLLTVILLAILQISWPEFLVFFYARPDLLLIFVVASVFYLELNTALVLAVLCGFLKDVFLPGDFGMNTVLFGILCYLIWLTGRQISTEQTGVRLVIVLAAALVSNIVSGFRSVNLGNHIPAGIFLRNLIFPSFYTTALSPLVFKLTKKIAA